MTEEDEEFNRIERESAMRQESVRATMLSEQPAQQDSTCSNALRAQGKAYPRTCKKCGLGPCVGLAQQALDKKAENARELGLDYEPDIPFGDNNPGLPWDEVPQAFNDWWNADYDPTGNPFGKDTHAYWAWAGWKAAKQPAQQEVSYEALKIVASLAADKVIDGHEEGILRSVLNKNALAPQPAQQEPDVYGYASRLATHIWQKHYIKDAPQWRPFDDLIGVLTQIDNMTTGLTRTTPPQRKPLTDDTCKWARPDSDHMPDTWEASCGAMWTFTEGGPKDNDMHFCPNCGKPAIEAEHNIKENT